MEKIPKILVAVLSLFLLWVLSIGSATAAITCEEQINSCIDTCLETPANTYEQCRESCLKNTPNCLSWCDDIGYTSCMSICDAITDAGERDECKNDCYYRYPGCPADDCIKGLYLCYNTCGNDTQCYSNCEQEWNCADICLSFDICNQWCYDNVEGAQDCLDNCEGAWPDCLCEDYNWCIIDCDGQEDEEACKEDCEKTYPDCAPQNNQDDCEDYLSDCYTACNGDTTCLNNCDAQFDCEEPCGAYNACVVWCDTYDSGSESCIINCNTQYPDCAPEEQTCEEQLNTCFNICEGDLYCIQSCNLQYECGEPCLDWQFCHNWCDSYGENPETCHASCDKYWPDCPPSENSCEENLKICYSLCETPECFFYCSTAYPCQGPCESWEQCRDYCTSPYNENIDTENCIKVCNEYAPECEEPTRCDEAEMQALQVCLNYCPEQQDIPACEESCYTDHPNCPRQEEYRNCYELCLDNNDTAAELIACIQKCQEDYPNDEWQPPYNLKEPRCFQEVQFFDYADVPYTNWAWPSINLLTRLEIKPGGGTGPDSETFHSRIVRGYNRDDNNDMLMKPGEVVDEFLPTRELNRYEASKIAILISCYTIPNSTQSISKVKIFPDLDENSEEYMNRVVYRAVEVGLFQGYNDGYFKPMQSITRAEFLKTLLIVGNFDVNQSSYASSGFTDVTDPSVWYYPYIAYASNLPIPIVKGYEDGTFRPNDPILRDEAMIIITNTMLNLNWINK